jgi:hypothetical protein
MTKKNLVGWALLSILAFCAVAPAHAVANKVFLKPDSAYDAVCTAWGDTNRALACGKATAPQNGSKLNIVGLFVIDPVAVGTAEGGGVGKGIYASTTVAVTSTYQTVISSGGAVALTSTPSISTTTSGGLPFAAGTLLIITSTATAPNAVVFTDNGTLSNSLLYLGASTRTVSLGRTLTLIFGADGFWREQAFATH